MILTKQHEMIRKLAREFAVTELAPLAAEIDRTGHYPEELIKKIQACEFHCVTIPEEYGGCGGDYLSSAIVMEEICRVDASSGSQIMPNSLSGAPLMYFGNEQQKQKYLRLILNTLGLKKPNFIS